VGNWVAIKIAADSSVDIIISVFQVFAGPASAYGTSGVGHTAHQRDQSVRISSRVPWNAGWSLPPELCGVVLLLFALRGSDEDHDCARRLALDLADRAICCLVSYTSSGSPPASPLTPVVGCLPFWYVIQRLRCSERNAGSQKVTGFNRPVSCRLIWNGQRVHLSPASRQHWSGRDGSRHCSAPRTHHVSHVRDECG